jgi:hypothetical protein
MSNRNFDAHAIILRLQNKNIAQSNYAHQKYGQAIINNPQTSNGNASVMPYYIEGTGTTYQQSLESTYSISLGGIYNLLGPTISMPSVIPPGDVPPAPVITLAMSNRRYLQYLIIFTQLLSVLPITNYSYSIDGVIYTALSPSQTTSALTLTFPATGDYSVRIKAINAAGSSLPSNAWPVSIM